MDAVFQSRNPALEEAIVRDPDDLASYAVYGDWLGEQGDPRGELIATQLAAAATDDAEMRRAALRVFARHREAFLGELADTIAAEAFTWRAGFIQRAKLSHDALLFVSGVRVPVTLVEVVAKLLAHPSARFLTELELGPADRDRWRRPLGTHRAAIKRISAVAPPTLRRLALADSTITPALVEVLARTRFLAHLHDLDLARCQLGGGALRALLEHADHFAHLARFALSASHLGPAAPARLANALPGLVLEKL
ncbi:MAG: TIGR02996 domain-containing protein [Deltaproteobacteria bacterium]|nr:TIGR02996 domain-containing protein [Deltaproteobacteria bacterium]MDQ3296953.1 TIGR02996 domain-containing protein [Myxococcota bacterium]